MKKLILNTALNFILLLVILYPLYFVFIGIKSISRESLLFFATIIVNTIFCLIIQILILGNNHLITKSNYRWLLVCQAIEPYLLFLGYFFVESWIFVIVFFLILVVIWKLMGRVNLMFYFVALFILILGTLWVYEAGFEEGYCMKVGNSFNDEIKYDLRDYEIESLGNLTAISLKMRKHLECHQNFSFPKALMHNYFGI